MKFIIATEYVNETEYMNFVLPFEQLYRDINSEEISSENLNILKIKLLDIVILPTLKLKAVELRQILVAERNLTKQKDIIQKADKGSTVVILDKKFYIKKMKELLSCTSKFERLEIPPDKHLNFVINS